MQAIQAAQNPKAETQKYPWGQFIAASAIGAAVSVMITHVVGRMLSKAERSENPEALPPPRQEAYSQFPRFSEFASRPGFEHIEKRNEHMEQRIENIESYLEELGAMK